MRIVIPIPIIIVLLGLGVYSALPHPTHDPARLQAVAAESRRLLAAYPIGPSNDPVDIPADKWPPGIASLKPEFVVVYRGTVNITTKPYFDGGWGYGYAANKQDLSMLVECWSDLGHDMYWRGPC